MPETWLFSLEKCDNRAALKPRGTRGMKNADALGAKGRSGCGDENGKAP